MPSILLASNSPRRKELLALTGLPFVILPVNVDETPKPKEDPESCARRLAETKAQTAVNQAEVMGFPTDQLILASDTIVVMDGEILGKPTDEADAKRMLKLLKGKTHQVITAICIQRIHSDERATDVCISPVPMRKYTDEEISAYVETGDPLDKAGAYAIQHSGFHPVHGMKDCYASVMGLPLCHVSRLMTRFGISGDDEMPTACQQYLNYKCPVFSSILGTTE
jgi:MAF protein